MEKQKEIGSFYFNSIYFEIENLRDLILIIGLQEQSIKSECTQKGSRMILLII